MFKRIWVVFFARNIEFYRDRGTFLWNILFPVLIVAGFSFVFSGGNSSQYKAGVLVDYANKPILNEVNDQYINLKKTRFIEFVDFHDKEIALDKLSHHRIDILLSPSTGVYWVNKTSPKSYMVEKLLDAALVADTDSSRFKKKTVAGREIQYAEWLFPGILGMNMMFSALFGVGFVIVRYRKNGVLKRFSCTPLRPHEFLIAQILSRMFVILTSSAFVFAIITLIFKFKCMGSYLDLLIIFAAGAFAMISMGLIIASRGSSEEFANGFLNLVTWPMMLMSEVWFSLEGADHWVIYISKIFPLTYIVDGMRKVMNDGASLYDIRVNLIVLLVMSAVFLTVGSLFFKWSKDN